MLSTSFLSLLCKRATTCSLHSSIQVLLAHFCYLSVTVQVRHSSNALRLEDGIEGMALLVAKNGGGGYLAGVGAANDPPALLVFIRLLVLSCN
jgi:hypothetical protein